MSALQRMIDAAKSEHGFSLAGDRRADTGIPDSPESRGSVFLLNVRDDVVERVEHLRETHKDDPDYLARLLREHGDLVHEIADAAVPVYTHPAWQTFVDLAAYQEDVSEFGESTADAFPNTALYMIASRLADRLLDDMAEAATEDARNADDDEDDK